MTLRMLIYKTRRIVDFIMDDNVEVFLRGVTRDFDVGDLF